LVLSQDIPISVLKYTLALVLMEQDSLSACDHDLTTVPTAQDLQDPPLQDPASHLAHRSEPLILHSSGDEPPTVLVSKTGKLPSISDRERQILSCLVSGLSNKTIGRNLDIAEGTVKVHGKSVLRKIKARNRTQAAVWALNNRINDRERESYPLGTDPQVVSEAAVMELM
jgi:DNA-binding NarL/FixJ family response regulator